MVICRLVRSDVCTSRQRYHIIAVRYLVEHGADIEIANRHGHTPLMIAAYRNKLEVVRYLLSRAAEVNRRSSRGASNFLICAEIVNGIVLGNTCLHDAAEAGSVRIVKELLAAGKDYGFLF